MSEINAFKLTIELLIDDLYELAKISQLEESCSDIDKHNFQVEEIYKKLCKCMEEIL